MFLYCIIMDYTYKNIGSSQTIIGTTPQNTKTSELNWHTEYDGEKATVLTETIENGKTNYSELSFTNKELADIGGIINVPKHLESIDSRLLHDYPDAIAVDEPFRHNVLPNTRKRVRISGGRSKKMKTRKLSRYKKKTKTNSKYRKKTKRQTKTTRHGRKKR
jgi:hypothetical protein